ASAWRTASAAMLLDSWTRRGISAIELDSSSDAAAAGGACSEAGSEGGGGDMRGSGLRGAGGRAGKFGGGARGLGELAGDALELAGRVHNLVDNAADAGL